MIRFRNFLPLTGTALLVGVAMLAQASPARAGFTVTLKTTGQSDQTFNLISGQLNTGSATIGAYTVQVTATGHLNTLPTANLTLTGPIMSGSVANSASGILSLGSTFTLGNDAIVAFTNNGKGTANFTVTTLAPVPEPSTVVAALTGLP